MTATATLAPADQARYDRTIAVIENQVRLLNLALGLDPRDYSNRVSFGYLGNLVLGARGRDDRTWMVFLPHPGRPGNYGDQLGGFRTNDVDGAVDTCTQLIGAVQLAKQLAGRGRLR